MFDPRTTSREEWSIFHEFRHKRHEEHNPGDPIQAKRHIEKWLTQQLKYD
ncbi:MAG: hypothetical protein ACFFB3_21205 [Candidatus Hodarchaeota archaeon]